jgi:hypothetical protein
MLIGLLSANNTEIEKKLDDPPAMVVAHGRRVAGRLVQRRGVSHGGAAKMSTPFSRRTLLSPGKSPRRCRRVPHRQRRRGRLRHRRAYPGSNAAMHMDDKPDRRHRFLGVSGGGSKLHRQTSKP